MVVMAEDNPKPVYVSKRAIRDAFNAEGFPEKIRKGLVSVRVEKSWEAPPGRLFLKPGAISRSLLYIGGNGKKLALVHEYRQPDGSLGASGQPDPKWLLVGDELWIVDPNDRSD
jgi:hypothetical protein